MASRASIHLPTCDPRTAWIAASLVVLVLLQACSASAPPARTPQAKDPTYWTPDGTLRASPKDEQAQWERAEKRVADAGGKPVNPQELLRYLRYSPDEPRAAQVRAWLDAGLPPHPDAAVVVKPDAACRVDLEKQYRGLFRLEGTVPFPAGAYVDRSTVVFPSRTGAPAVAEKRLIGELVVDPVTGHRPTR